MSIESEFERLFHAPPEHVVRAPGRVNLIGEHTDYNGGFVLPMAIDRQALIAARARPDRTVRLVALDIHGDQSYFALDAIHRDDAHAWSNYVRGVALALTKHGQVLTGLDMLITGDVPIGAGLSSSAALEVAAATAFLAFGGTRLGGVEIARLCQKAENEFVGVKSGIMDQFISALAHAAHALLIDCRDLSYQYVPMPPGATIVICDTGKRRGLVTSEYNTRRAECEQAARLLSDRLGRPVLLLRDVTPAEFTRVENSLPPLIARRARHIVTENERVLLAVEAMRQNDLGSLGKLMDASHASLREDYEVSSPELDAMVAIARGQPGCLGARLTGAGFGGCTVNLVQDEAVPTFMDAVSTKYSEKTRLEPHLYACRAAPGASILV